MAERRKILIPTGAEDSGPLETPHFDTEAARAARPVVPLASPSGELEPLPQSVHFTQSEPVRRGRVSPWLLALVILAAMSVGAAGALALDYYRNHKHDEAQAAIQPSDAAIPTDAHPVQTPPLEENHNTASPAAPASINTKKDEQSPSPASNASTAAAVVKTEKSPEPVARPKSPATQPERSAREERKQDERPQPDAREARREKQREAMNEEGPDDPDPRRPGRRQRHPRDPEIRPEDVPPQLKRANQELHRIREIFEGPRP
jgi:hypothetical protein